jgi:multidrug resistance protein, MATE family
MAAGNSQNDLQVETSNRQILKIALPISLAMLVPQINFLVNNVFLSGLGETELGTAGITGVFYLIFALVGNGLNSGLQGLLARRAGENRPQEIGKLFAQGLWIALFFAAAAILLTYCIGPVVLSGSIHSDKVYHDAMGFLRIRVWGIPFLYLFQMCNALLVGTNNSRYMKYGFWVQALLNILLDYLLIYGHWGMPELGFNGAAYASVIAEIAGMLVVLGIVLYKKFHHRFALFQHWRYTPPMAGLIFRQSSPLVAQYLLSILAWFLFYIFIEHKGERQLAISNAMRNIFGVFGIFTWAFASTANAMVSNIIGQGKKEQVISLIVKIMKLSVFFTMALCLLVNLFPGLFLSIYGRDESFVSEAIPVIRMVTVGIMSMSVATVWLNSVTGTGNTRVNLAIEIVAIRLYTIYIYLVLKVWDLDLVWAWASEMLYWSILFILSFLYIRSGKWKKKVI